MNVVLKSVLDMRRIAATGQRLVGADFTWAATRASRSRCTGRLSVSVERGAGRAALMIYIEPTPYVLALIRRIASTADAPVDVLFIAANVSQVWDLSLEDTSSGYLPGGTWKPLGRSRQSSLRQGTASCIWPDGVTRCCWGR